MELSKRNIKIIIISGKAKSGKNLIANIIKNNIYNKKTIILAYAFYLKEYAKNISSWDGNENNKPRTLLQELGIELIKNKIDENLLIRRMLEDIEIYSYFFDIVIISDARFANEINVIKDKYEDVITIHVDGIENDLTDEQRSHITENALDNYDKYDYIIKNNGTKKDLEEKIDMIMGRIV